MEYFFPFRGFAHNNIIIFVVAEKQITSYIKKHMLRASSSLRPALASLEDALAGHSRVRAFISGACVAAAGYYGFRLLKPGFLVKRFLQSIFAIVRTLAASLVDKEVAKAAKDITFKQLPNEVITEEIPAHGMKAAAVVALAHQLHDELDCTHETGELSGTVYHGGREHTKFINDIMNIYQWTNPLHLDVHNAVRKMEAEIVEMVVRLFHGNTHRASACGALTSGGTESIGMAVKAYREWGREMKCITEPNIVMPITAHPAFDKAGRYYNVQIIKVPVDWRTGRVDPREMEKYINVNTVALVGSAPNFPYGAVDPIADIGQLAVRYGLGLHVDACLGGFLVQFMGRANPLWEQYVDFRVEGVTSISCDTHKFGYAPKGTSVIMYASKELRRYQFFATADWPGGLYASPGASGSKAGNVIAGTWAALMCIGMDGYVRACHDVITTAHQMRDGVNDIPELYILGEPVVSAVSFTSSTLDIYILSDRLKKKGWKLNPLQFPSGIQFSLTLVHTRNGIMDRFLREVRDVTMAMIAERDQLILDGGKPLAIGDQGGTMYGSQQRIADRSIVEKVTHAFLEGYYRTRHVQPSETKGQS